MDVRLYFLRTTGPQQSAKQARAGASGRRGVGWVCGGAGGGRVCHCIRGFSEEYYTPFVTLML